MGKVKQRRKLHAPAIKLSSNDSKKVVPEMETSQLDEEQHPILLQPTENLFADIKIDLNNLKTNLQDDVRSVKSFKSLKSEKESGKKMAKKDKLKLRRETLLKKIDTVNQMKLQEKRRHKRKNVSIIGDTNPLHDALPSLESLLKSSKSSGKTKTNEVNIKSKGTAKSSRRKKDAVQGVKMLKQLMGNKEFKKDPLKAIGEHIQTIVAQTRGKIK